MSSSALRPQRDLLSSQLPSACLIQHGGRRDSQAGSVRDKCSMHRGLRSRPLQCRAARICHAAAHGGQILASEIFMEYLLADWAGASERLSSAGQSTPQSRLSISRKCVLERASHLTAARGVSKAWQDCCEQAGASMASVMSAETAELQQMPGPQVELAAMRKSLQDLELQPLPKSLILSSQDTLHTLLACSQARMLCLFPSASIESISSHRCMPSSDCTKYWPGCSGP